MSASAEDIFLSPKEIIENDQDQNLIAGGLAEILDLDPADILKKMEKTTSQYEILVKKADDELAGLETRDGGILGDERFDLLEVRGRVDEALRDVLLGLSEDREDLALLDDAAVFHDGDAIADLLDDSHLVRDEHDGQSELAVQVAKQVQNCLLYTSPSPRD